MKCAHDPTGSIQPVALKTGLNIRCSRHYLIAFAVIGVVYLLYASRSLPLQTHDTHDTRRDQIDLASGDHSQISSADHDRASMKSVVGARKNAVSPPQDWIATIERQIEEEELAPKKTADTTDTRYRFAARRHGFVSHVSGRGWDISPWHSLQDPKGDKDPRLKAMKSDRTQSQVSSTPQWKWRYALTSVIRGSAIRDRSGYADPITPNTGRNLV